MIRLRNDIVVHQVDGIWLLIALRSAWGECPFAVPASPVHVEMWNSVKAGKSEEEILGELQGSRGFSEEKARKVWQSFLKAAENNHYILEEDRA